MIVGCKLLQEDGTSLNGKFRYQHNEWQEVPGNGAYVAITAELVAGGQGPVLAYFECEDPTEAEAPDGVVCFRRVRWIEPAPDRISPELRGQIVRHAPGLSPDQRYDLALRSTPEWQGRCARHAPEFSPDQRYKLALKSTPQWQSECAYLAPGLSPDQRTKLLQIVLAQNP